jgi:hypothetical protein
MLIISTKHHHHYYLQGSHYLVGSVIREDVVSSVMGTSQCLALR